MDWKYKCKRLFGNRYAMTAILFAAISAWGFVTVLLGMLELDGGCAGYAVPGQSASAAVKTDPARPRRELAAAVADLDLPGQAEAWPGQLSARTAQVEKKVTRALERDRHLIELFGAFQSFSDRTVVEDTADPRYSVVRMADGTLTFAGQGDPDPQVQASQLARLRDALADREIAFLYLQAPSKLEPGKTGLPYAVEDTSNACADRLLAALEALEVDTMDLRQVLQQAGGRWRDWFYKTDHHWTQEAAFCCFQALCDRLEGYTQTLRVGLGTKRQSIAIHRRYTDPGSYDKNTLSAFFLGSQGKRVGTLYAGTDDFVLWTPRFPTLLHYSTGSGPDRYGDAADTVLFPQRVEERDYYDANPYTYYSGGDYAFAQLTNYYEPQGPRILLIRDSFACALTPYLALCSSQLTTIDPRSFGGDLLSTVEWLKPDVVIVLYSSGMVREEEPYRLLAQPRPSKGDALRWKTALP